MSSGPIHRTEKRKWRLEGDEENNTTKRRDMEKRQLGGRVPGEEDRIVRSLIEGEASNWLPSPLHNPGYDTALERPLPPVTIPTGPKASYCAPSYHPFPIDVRALCTPETRSLFTWEIDKLGALQTKIEKATVGAGPSLRILANIPGSIQLTAQQKERVYAAQDILDLAVLQNKLERAGGGGRVGRSTAQSRTPQHDNHVRHDSDDWVILTLPPLHLSNSLEGALVAHSMMMYVNDLLSARLRERVKFSFDAADRETLQDFV